MNVLIRLSDFQFSVLTIKNYIHYFEYNEIRIFLANYNVSVLDLTL